MMNTTAYALTVAMFVAAVFADGCDEYIEADNLTYVERMVVSGVLEAGSDTARILITRTLPLDEQYTFEQAVLHDVHATVTGNGTTRVLVEQQPGVYVTQLSIQSGNVYELQAEWNGLHVHASTLVPTPVTPDTVWLVADTLYYASSPGYVPFPVVQWRVESVFSPRPQEVYELIATGGYPARVVRPQAARADGKLALSANVYRFAGQGSVDASILAYDEPFYDYVTSNSGGTQNDDLVFSFVGAPVKWNVMGDGIGMFIGRATTTRRLQ